MTQKLTLGIFSNTLSHDSLRGANRLFHALFDGLRARDDVRIILLNHRVPYELSPNSTLYYGRELTAGDSPVAPLPHKPLSLEEMLLFTQKTRRGIRHLRGYYQRLFPAWWRKLFSPVTRPGERLLYWMHDVAEHRLQALYAPLARRGLERLTMVELAKNLLFPPANAFSNADIPSDAFDLRDLDVILNFWWLHLPGENPMFGVTPPANVPVYGWLLDASPLRLPHWQPGLINETEFRRHVLAHLRTATRVAAISHSAAQDAGLFFGVPAEKTAIIPCGVTPRDFEISYPKTQIADCLQRFKLDANTPLIMVLGVQEPTKNIVNILKALHLIGASSTSPLQCVFSGAHRGFDPAQQFGALLSAMPAHITVRFVGSVAEDDKRMLLISSQLLLYPSVWEGFGIPPLEAMAAGVPVVTSDVASLPEVCGEHASYCDPYNPADMADKIQSVLGMDATTRATRIEAAKTYARQWLWAERAIPMLLADMRAHVAPGGAS